MINSILKVVTGVVKLRGDSDSTRIGNVFDALKVVLAYGQPTNQEPFIHPEGSQTLNVETQVGSIVLDNSKKYGNIECQVINFREALWRLAREDDGTYIDLGFATSGAGREDTKLNPSVKDFITGATGTQRLIIYMTPLDVESDSYVNLSASKLN